MKSDMWIKSNVDRRAFIGGSDARIIMGDDEAALLRLWREKRGEVEPEDLSANLIVQLGTVTEHLNRHWYERNTGQVVDRGAAAGVSSGQALDGGHLGRHGRGDRRRVRGQVHAAMVVLGGRRGREAHGPAAAQHVGHRLPDGGAVDHYRGRQMGGDDHSGRSALPASAADRGKEVLALRGNRRGPSPVWRRAATGKDRGGPDRRYERRPTPGPSLPACFRQPGRRPRTTSDQRPS